jgi:hypothetical protein
MKPVERDLLILLNESDYSEADIEKEASLIGTLLATVETTEKLLPVVELLHFNRSRIIRRQNIIVRFLHKKQLPSFCFFLHKN